LSVGDRGIARYWYYLAHTLKSAVWRKSTDWRKFNLWSQYENESHSKSNLHDTYGKW
jgi:hypothetical protein